MSLSQKFILEVLKKKHITLFDFEKQKKEYAKKYKTGCFSNIKLLETYRDLVKKNKIKENQTLFNLLRKQKTRTLSGIASVAVLVKPWPCPGKCLYCPDEKGMPKSYFSDEPAVMRAVLNNFDPAKQVKTRIEALHLTGHKTNKIELIIMGGTFSTLPKQYQTWFIKRCFEAANSVKTQNFVSSQKQNESAQNRIIGLTLETRPDYINKEEIKRFRMLGCTRVEIGVQSIFDDVLEKNQRGHSVETTIRATKLLKDAGFKINYHLMPNMYGSTPGRDLEMFQKIFKKPEFQPDLIKIYPCVVTRDSKLGKYFKQKKFIPYSDQELIKLIVQIKKIIPPYVRIMRLGRDIPATDIVGGNTLSNIRQYVQAELKKKGEKCECVRCREVKDEILDPKDIKLIRRDYDASDGREIFLSFEDLKKNKIVALLRLRIPSKNVYLKILENSSIIREVHTYGQMLNFSKRNKESSQHLGFGKKLIMEAERITRNECSLNKIAVISGIGARRYYRKYGYRLKETYMIKNFAKSIKIN